MSLKCQRSFTKRVGGHRSVSIPNILIRLYEKLEFFGGVENRNDTIKFH